MTDALIDAALLVSVVTLALTALTTVIPYMDGRKRIRRNKWVVANALAWACYSRGIQDDRRRTDKLAARAEARRGKP